ncbi:MAG: extracellular solute-binding protein [Proteobacteria bacterium]|nr:extracellular solute-binding protein [Pseudomonadota bacterium]
MKRLVALVFLLLLVPLTTGTGAAADRRIVFWTVEAEKDRVEVQNRLADDFRKRTGIAVQVVPVRENRLVQRIMAAFAARSLPDVVFHPLDFTIGWAEAGILDIQSAVRVLNHLDPGTFGRGPLDMVQARGGHAAVPVDGWGQLLLYRRDLFGPKSLAVPDHWAAILGAAGALHRPPEVWGFEAATDPGQVYTQQVFEHFALSNGVRLVGADGRVDLDTPAMVETLEFYKSLAGFSPSGNLYWLHTRLDYLSGRAAMIVWSPFILDELSGLRRDQPVVPDLARDNPGFLAKNTGFVSRIKGPAGGPAQYGQVGYLGITVDADRGSAEKWVEYLLSDGYLTWLGMAAEGKLPVRKGTADDPERFVRGWKNLEFGVTTRARISEFYGEETVRSIIAGVDEFDRWGFGRGKGALVAKIYGTKVVPEVLKTFLDGRIDARQAARTLDRKIKALE